QGTSAAQPITLSGYIKGVGTFNNVTFSGTFDPGFSPALLTVGSIALSSSSLLNIELGGTSRGSTYDAILASGTLGLGGALQVSLINSFSPALGNHFDILDWSSLNGTFSSLQLPALGGTLGWNASALYLNGVLSVIDTNFLPGDFDRDGHVNVADISAAEGALSDLSGYQALHGNMTSAQLVSIGDLDGDGLVDNSDLQGLMVVLANGGGSGAGSVSAVP